MRAGDSGHYYFLALAFFLVAFFFGAALFLVAFFFGAAFFLDAAFFFAAMVVYLFICRDLTFPAWLINTLRIGTSGFPVPLKLCDSVYPGSLLPGTTSLPMPVARSYASHYRCEYNPSFVILLPSHHRVRRICTEHTLHVNSVNFLRHFA